MLVLRHALTLLGGTSNRVGVLSAIGPAWSPGKTRGCHQLADIKRHDLSRSCPEGFVSQIEPGKRQISSMAVTTGGQASTGTAPPLSETAPQETISARQLSIRNKLLFAQAVHRLGAPIGKSVGNNWNAVINLLRQCPALTEEEKGIFTEHVSFVPLSTVG